MGVRVVEVVVCGGEDYGWWKERLGVRVVEVVVSGGGGWDEGSGGCEWVVVRKVEGGGREVGCGSGVDCK